MVVPDHGAMPSADQACLQVLGCHKAVSRHALRIPDRAKRRSSLALPGSRQAFQQTDCSARDGGASCIQVAVPALRASDKEIPRHQRVAARRDGLGPVAGGAGVGNCRGRNWHTVAATKAKSFNAFEDD